MELRDKTIFFLGSSVTYGAASGGISFADLMVERCGIKMIKEAVSGTTLADTMDKSYVSRLKKIDKNTKVDLFICQLSTNDADTNKVPNPVETETAIRFIITYIKQTFGCPIVFYTGTYFNNWRYEKMVHWLKDLKKEYDFHIIDFWDDPEMRAVSEEDYKRYMHDSVHPKYDGYSEWWTPKFIEFCEAL